jgi:uncharacterized protein (TIGR02284 family)
MNNSEVISTLNNLIETCKDGQEGFKQSAEGIERSDLKSVFYEFSQQRAQFVGELQSLVHELAVILKIRGALPERFTAAG